MWGSYLLQSCHATRWKNGAFMGPNDHNDNSEECFWVWRRCANFFLITLNGLFHIQPQSIYNLYIARRISMKLQEKNAQISSIEI